MAAEPVGLASGLLTLAVFAYKSATKLHETIQNFRSHPRQVRELLTELAGLRTVLQKLSQTTVIDADVDLSALETTLEQCNRACGDFESELVKYSSRSSDDRTSLRDWFRLKYRGGDGIEGFRQQLIGYKSTINVALSFANLRTSTITVEAILSCRSELERTTLDLQDHLDDIQQKLASLSHRTNPASDQDAIVKHIENERLSTEKGLQLCLDLSHHIDQIQLQYAADEEHRPHISGHSPTSKVLVDEGLDGCKDYIDSVLQKLENHRQKVADRLITDPTTAVSSDDKALLDKLQGEADSIRQRLKFCSNIDSYLEEQMSNIENHAEGDDTIQFMVSTDGKRFNGKNHGTGLRLKQAGGHFDNTSLQQISQDFAAISAQQVGNKKSAEGQPASATAPTSGAVSSDSFSGPGFTLASKSPPASNPPPGSAAL